MLDVSATAVAFFSKRLKLQMSNGVLMVHDIILNRTLKEYFTVKQKSLEHS